MLVTSIVLALIVAVIIGRAALYGVALGLIGYIAYLLISVAPNDRQRYYRSLDAALQEATKYKRR